MIKKVGVEKVGVEKVGIKKVGIEKRARAREVRHEDSRKTYPCQLKGRHAPFLNLLCQCQQHPERHLCHCSKQGFSAVACLHRPGTQPHEW